MLNSGSMGLWVEGGKEPKVWGAAGCCGSFHGVSRLEVRVCVHLDCWALFVSRGRPEKDLDFVRLGCLAGWSVMYGGSP